MLKISVCASLREIRKSYKESFTHILIDIPVPYSYRKIRWSIIGVCVVAIILAILEFFLGLFECYPSMPLSLMLQRILTVW